MTGPIYQAHEQRQGHRGVALRQQDKRLTSGHGREVPTVGSGDSRNAQLLGDGYDGGVGEAEAQSGILLVDLKYALITAGR